MAGSKKKKDIDVDEREMISLLKRDSETKLKNAAGKYVDVPETGKSGEGKIADTVMSPGLKLRLKDDKGSWDKGMMWVVTDPRKHPEGRHVKISPQQILLTHTDEHGNTEDMVVLKSELDDVFELQ